VSSLGTLISNAKLLAAGDPNAKANIETAVPLLIRSVNQIFTTPVAAQPQLFQQKARSFPSFLHFFFFF